MWKGIGDGISSPNRFEMRDSILGHLSCDTTDQPSVVTTYVDAECLLRVVFSFSLLQSMNYVLIWSKVVNFERYKPSVLSGVTEKVNKSMREGVFSKGCASLSIQFWDKLLILRRC
jgi:hypothetical protein